MIAVTFALPAESSEFLRRLGNKSRADRNGVRVVRGTIGHRSIEVIHTGVGENSCKERIGKFLENQQFDFLISAGFAGSLDDQLGERPFRREEFFDSGPQTPLAFKRVDLCGQHVDSACGDRFRRGARENSARIGSLCGRHGNRIHCARLRGPRHSAAGAARHHRHPNPTIPCSAECVVCYPTATNSHRRPHQVFPRPSEAHAGSGSVREENFARTKNFVECASPDRARPVASAAAIPARGYSCAGSMCTSTSAMRESLCWMPPLLDARSRGLRARKCFRPLRRVDRRNNQAILRA